MTHQHLPTSEAGDTDAPRRWLEPKFCAVSADPELRERLMADVVRLRRGD